MTATDHYKQIVFEATFGAGQIDFANTYIGLSPSSPAVDATIPTEFVGSGYERIPFIPSTVVDGEVSNTTECVWTAAADWGSLGCVFLSNSSQGGKSFVYGVISSVGISAGTIIRLPIGNLVIT